MKFILILVMIVSLFSFLYTEIRKKTVMRIQQYVKQKKYSDLEHFLQHPLLRLFFSSSALLHLQLEVAIL